MLIQDLVDIKSSFDAKNEPKNLNPYGARSEVKKAILASRVRNYIVKWEILASNMNRIYGIIWGRFNPGLQSVLKGKKYYPTKSKISDSLWLM